ncbi:MAG: hypothetical protein ABIU54_05115 [Candidatus Eisenbacteria bacterium]
MSRLSRLSLVLFLLIPVLAASCGKKTQDTTVQTQQPASKVAVTTVELGRSVGADGRITDRVDAFKPTDVIYASVSTTGASASSVLRARWTFQDGQLVDQSERTIAPSGDAVTEFHISKPDGWPTGKYKVEVFVDGNSSQSRDFEVKR